jgi:hypothetical protein
MKKLCCVLLVLAIAVSAFAEKKQIDFKIKGTPPTVTGTDSNSTAAFNSEIQSAFDEALGKLNDQLNEIGIGQPTNLLGSMANSSAFGSHGATTSSYGGYKKFSATIGPMVGLRLPTDIWAIMDEMDKMSEKLEENGDVSLGVSPNLFNINFGLNMDFLKLEKLYMGVRLGFFKLPDGLIEGFSYDNFLFGVTANYQIIPSVNLAKIITWRGVNLGSGLLFNTSNIGFTIPMDEDIDEPITGGGRIYMKPEAALNMKVFTCTIPLEAVTAIKILFINIPLGLGVDIAFGETSLGFGVNSDIELKDLPYGFHQATNGDISVKAGASSNPDFFNFKIMTGLGFQIGPVVIDIPFTFYPAVHPGYNLGLTIGAVF